ncbi:MAG TPA: PEGA domain-containing protein, partial [Myxococcales bacterium]|nr:PEGA domain-containing protein [Myxococcales bacterium]
DRAVLGTLRRDEKNYLVQLWLLDLKGGKVIAEVDRAILIASRRLVQDVTDAVPPLLRGEGERFGKLTITSPVKGAEVMLNGEPLGRTPVSTQLKPGRYEIQVTKKNHMAVQRLVDVNAGQTTVEEVRLILLPGMRAEPEAVASAGDKAGGEAAPSLPWTAWLAFGTSAVAAGTGGYLGIQARNIEGRLQLGKDPVTGVYAGTRAEALAGRNNAVAANVFYGVALAAAAGGVLLTVYAPPEAPPVKAGASIGPSGPVAAIQGSF